MTALRALAAAFAVGAVVCMVFATAGMVTGRQTARTGWVLRALALLCFAITVVLNVAAH